MKISSIKTFRKQYSLTQWQLAQMLQTTRGHIANVENKFSTLGPILYDRLLVVERTAKLLFNS